MAVLSFTNCVIDVTIIILCPPFPSLPPSSLSAKHQEPERRDRKAVRLTSPFTCRMRQLSYIQAFRLWTFKHVNMQLVPAQGQNLCHQCQAWVKLQLTPVSCHWRLPVPWAPTSAPSSIRRSSPLFPQCLPLCASCCTGLLYFSRPCTVKLKMFSLFFEVFSFLCIICVKILQAYYSTV